MDPQVMTSDVLDCLLSRDDPALRVRVLTDLLERPADDPEVMATRKRISRQPWVKATLAACNGDGTWGRGFYHKYDGTSWTLLHLSEVGAPMDLPPIRAGVERLIDTARPVEKMRGSRAEAFRNLSGGFYWEHPIACLTAHMALVLIRAGRVDHPVTRGALEVCRHRFDPGPNSGGFGCFVLEDSLLPACVMTVPKVLKALLALPAEHRRAKDRSLIGKTVKVLKKFNLYEYVPRDGGKWREYARDATLEQRRRARSRWIAAGRLEPRRAKEGWLRFSFPHSHNSDLLEVLLLLGEAGTRRDRTIDAGLEMLRLKQQSNGMWKMDGGLNGKMHAALDHRGRSSPWITYRALLAFKRFSKLVIPDA